MMTTLFDVCCAAPWGVDDGADPGGGVGPGGRGAAATDRPDGDTGMGYTGRHDMVTLLGLCWLGNPTTVETRNLEVPGTWKNNSKHPEIDSSESGFLYVIEI